MSETETAVAEKPVPTRLYVAVHKARAAMSMVAMSGENKFDRYVYAKLADYLEAIQKPLDDNGLIVVSHIDEINWLQDRETKGGGYEKVCRIKLSTTVIHAESGESMSVWVLGEGQDRSDKAFYKADTGARKYALANLFNLATDDDPETGSSEGGVAAPARRDQAASTTAAAAAKPADEAAELEKHKVAMKAWPAAKILQLINAAETIELLQFTVDGAEAGDAWAEIDQREPMMLAIRERYMHIIKNTPAGKRNGGLEDAFKKKMVAHKEKLALDKEMEEFQRSMENDDKQTKQPEAAAT